LKTGVLLRRLQRGETLSLPASRPMPTIGRRCHELRIRDAQVTWRIIYRSDRDAIIIVEVFAKQTAATPKIVIESCQKRIRQYDEIVGGHKS
jgi:phage-related protein